MVGAFQISRAGAVATVRPTAHLGHRAAAGAAHAGAARSAPKGLPARKTGARPTPPPAHIADAFPMDEPGELKDF
jgi:hypothetical protein